MIYIIVPNFFVDGYAKIQPNTPAARCFLAEAAAVLSTRIPGRDVPNSQWLVDIPSGKQPHNYGKIHHFSWVNQLFWPFSIAMFVYQRVHNYTRPSLCWLIMIGGYSCTNMLGSPYWPTSVIIRWPIPSDTCPGRDRRTALEASFE